MTLVDRMRISYLSEPIILYYSRIEPNLDYYRYLPLGLIYSQLLLVWMISTRIELN